MKTFSAGRFFYFCRDDQPHAHICGADDDQYSANSGFPILVAPQELPGRSGHAQDQDRASFPGDRAQAAGIQAEIGF